MRVRGTHPDVTFTVRFSGQGLYDVSFKSVEEAREHLEKFPGHGGRIFVELPLDMVRINNG